MIIIKNIIDYSKKEAAFKRAKARLMRFFSQKSGFFSGLKNWRPFSVALI